MPTATAPALLVICGTMAGAGPSGRRQEAGGRPAGSLPVTWLAPVERLGAAAEAAGGNDVAVQVPAEGFASRQALRAVLTRARAAVPSLEAIAVDKAAAIAHRDLLVDEGVRVVLVDRLTGAGRSSRRPAPAGWRCRNVAWSLWEVEIDPLRPSGPFAVLGLGCGPRLRRGGLSVVVTAGALHPRLDRLLARARRLCDRGDATVVPLAGLVARLAGEDQAGLAGSILRAA